MITEQKYGWGRGIDVFIGKPPPKIDDSLRKKDIYFQVVFSYTKDGEVKQTIRSVISGGTVEPPSNDEVDEFVTDDQNIYSFTGWNYPLTNISKDQTITPVYSLVETMNVDTLIADTISTEENDIERIIISGEQQ